MRGSISKKSVALLILCLAVVPLGFIIWLYTTPAKVEVPSEILLQPNFFNSKFFLSIIAGASLIFFVLRPRKR